MPAVIVPTLQISIFYWRIQVSQHDRGTDRQWRHLPHSLPSTAIRHTNSLPEIYVECTLSHMATSWLPGTQPGLSSGQPFLDWAILIEAVSHSNPGVACMEHTLLKKLIPSRARLVKVASAPPSADGNADSRSQAEAFTRQVWSWRSWKAFILSRFSAQRIGPRTSPVKSYLPLRKPHPDAPYRSAQSSRLDSSTATFFRMRFLTCDAKACVCDDASAFQRPTLNERRTLSVLSPSRCSAKASVAGIRVFRNSRNRSWI